MIYKRGSLAEMVGLHMAGLDGLVEGRTLPPMPPDRHVFVDEREHPPLGFGPVLVAAGTTVTISQHLQFGHFRPYRFVVPSSLAAYFTIEDIRVGRNSQLSGPLPASVFSEDTVDPGVVFDSCQIGQLIAVLARNDGAGGLMFSGCLLGAEAGRRRGASNVRTAPRVDPIRYCDHCGAPPKRGHASDACYYCQRKR